MLLLCRKILDSSSNLSFDSYVFFRRSHGSDLKVRQYVCVSNAQPFTIVTSVGKMPQGEVTRYEKVVGTSGARSNFCRQYYISAMQVFRKEPEKPGSNRLKILHNTATKAQRLSHIVQYEHDLYYSTAERNPT